MIRASLCAVAVMALGAPSWAFLRRRKAPSALLERCRALAASRSAAAARLDAGLGPGADDPAAGDAVVGTQPQSGSEVAWPLAIGLCPCRFR